MLLNFYKPQKRFERDFLLDHVVLAVELGHLTAMVDFPRGVFGFQKSICWVVVRVHNRVLRFFLERFLCRSGEQGCVDGLNFRPVSGEARKVGDQPPPRTTQHSPNNSKTKLSVPSS